MRAYDYYHRVHVCSSSLTRRNFFLMLTFEEKMIDKCNFRMINGKSYAPTTDERIRHLKRVILAASLENGVLRQNLRSAKHRINQLESIELAEGDIRRLLKTQRQLQNEIRGGATHVSTPRPSAIEDKLLQLQLMLPDIIQGWQAKKIITASIGIHAVPITNSIVTFTGDDKRKDDRPVVTVDRTQRVPPEVWKTLSKARRARIRKREALEQAYVSTGIAPSVASFSSAIPEIMADESNAPPKGKKAKMIVEEGSTTSRSPTIRESITSRLVQVFGVDLDATPRYEEI